MSVGHLDLVIDSPTIPEWIINYTSLIGITCWMMWSVTWQIIKEPIVGRS